jgi:hypothetical protein
LRLQARQWPSVHNLHPFDRRHLTQRPCAGGGAVRRQPGEHLVLGEHRRPVARTPARIGDREEINGHGRLGVPLQPIASKGLPAGRRVREGGARLGLGQLPQDPRRL